MPPPDLSAKPPVVGGGRHFSESSSSAVRRRADRSGCQAGNSRLPVCSQRLIRASLAVTCRIGGMDWNGLTPIAWRPRHGAGSNLLTWIMFLDTPIDVEAAHKLRAAGRILMANRHTGEARRVGGTAGAIGRLTLLLNSSNIAAACHTQDMARVYQVRRAERRRHRSDPGGSGLDHYKLHRRWTVCAAQAIVGV